MTPKRVSLSLCLFPGADPGFLKKGGVHLRSTSKKRGPGAGQILGTMLKSLHRGPKRGGGPPAPPRSAHGLHEPRGMI